MAYVCMLLPYVPLLRHFHNNWENTLKTRLRFVRLLIYYSKNSSFSKLLNSKKLWKNQKGYIIHMKMPLSLSESMTFLEVFAPNSTIKKLSDTISTYTKKQADCNKLKFHGKICFVVYTSCRILVLVQALTIRPKRKRI